MAKNLIELVVGSIDEKKAWRAAKARQKELASPYREASEAIERYVMSTAGVVDGATLVDMIQDLLEMFERAAADGTPVSALLGEDPVEFAEEFIASYRGKKWTDKERAKLRDAITKADKKGSAS